MLALKNARYQFIRTPAAGSLTPSRPPVLRPAAILPRCAILASTELLVAEANVDLRRKQIHQICAVDNNLASSDSSAT